MGTDTHTHLELCEDCGRHRMPALPSDRDGLRETQGGDDALDDGCGTVAVVLLVTGRKWKGIVPYMAPCFCRAEGVIG